METSDKQKQVVLIYFGLIAGTLFIYGRSIGFDFITLDDPDYVTNNPLVMRGLSWQGMVWAFTTGHSSNWHPLTWISHMLDVQVWGLNPGGHHFTNIALHIANTLLLLRFLWRATGAMWKSAIVAALFAWHPLHVESVVWIAERKDVLSTLFWLLAAHAYLNYVKKPTPKLYGLGLLFFVLGLLSKPMVVTFPFVLLLLDFWPLKRITLEDWRSKIGRLVVEKIPFIALAAICSFITFQVQSVAGSVASANTAPLGSRIANAAVACVIYLRKAIWPSDLTVFYPLETRPMWLVAVAIVVLLALTVGAVIWRRRGYPLVGWLWYLGMLVPTIGLVQVGAQSLADRYTYLPIVGIFIAMVWGVSDLLGEKAQLSRLKIGFTALALGGSIAAASFQVGTWVDAETLFRHNLKVAKENFVAHDNLATVLGRSGRIEEGIVHAKRAIELGPRVPGPYNTLGWLYELQQDYDRAIHYYQAALEIQPRYNEARLNLGRMLAVKERWNEAAAQYEEYLRLDPKDAVAHHNLGAVLVRLNKPEEAIEHFKTSLQLMPGNAEVESQLGGAYQQLGQLDAALNHYVEAVRLNPNFAHARLKLGLILAQRQRFTEAREELLTAIVLEPTNAAAHYNLGGVFAAQGDFGRAAEAFAEVVRLRPDDADAHGRLAGVLAQGGKLDLAIAQYREAIRLQPDWAEALRALATLLATAPKAELRNGTEAMRFAERANELTKGTDPRMLAALDQAYAEVGRFEDAIRIAQQVQTLAGTNQPAVAENAGKRLERYRAGKANHE